MSEIEIGEAEEEELLKSDNEDAVAESGKKDKCEEDDSNSDDSSEDDEQNLLNEYLKILDEISENTSNYDKYIKLTETAFKLNDLSKIRESYTLFADCFPLSPSLWLKFILVEKNIVSSTAEINRVEAFFIKALTDYYSSNVALEFAEFASKLKNAKDIWSELLGTYALDVMVGRQFFLLYRKYNDKRDASDEEKRKCYIDSYLKELKLPLYEMEESYIDFKVFYEKNKSELLDIIEWDKVDKYYKRAKDDLARMLPYEQTLQSLENKFYQEKANTYQEYIKAANKFAAENVLQTIYERMVTDCCLNENCWIDYIEFLEKRENYERSKDLENFRVFQQTAFDMNERALKNCTWSEKLHICRIHISERLHKSKADLQEVLEKTLEVNFSTPEPSVAIWLEYLTYLRRHTDFENEKEVENLRKNFDFCWKLLGKQWGVLADCNCEILQLWGKLEYGPLRDPARGKELWKTVMESSDNSLKSGLWMEFIQLEADRDQESTRKIFRKALNTQFIDNPYVIASAWVRFERCHGSLKQLTYCQSQRTAVLKDYETKNKFRQYDMSTSKSKGTAVSKDYETKNKFRQYDQYDMSVSKGKGIKRKLPVENKKSDTRFSSRATEHNYPPKKTKTEEYNVEKHHENEEIDLTKDHLRIFLSNLHYNITDEDIQNGLSEIKINNINLIKTSTGKGRGFGYLELISEAEVQKALQLDGRMVNGRPLYISSVLRDKEKREKFKYSAKLEPKKLFVKGVPYDATKEELHTLFEPYGKLKDVRIVYHKSGKPKGIAYIEYENETDASLAVIKMDNFALRNFHFNVAISAPPPKQDAKELNVTQLLGKGLSVKRSIGQKGEQKTRISFLPTSVQKNISSSSQNKLTSSQNGNTNTKSPQKTNEDFRKLLQK